jgi:hypothetical protein
VFSKVVDPLALLGFMASRPVEYLLSLFIGELQGKAGVHPNHYEVGTIQRLPWPSLSAEQAEALSRHAALSVAALKDLQSVEEPSHSFISPLPDPKLGIRENTTLAMRLELTALQTLCEQRRAADDVVAESYGFEDSDRVEMNVAFSNRIPPSSGRWRVYFGEVGSDIDEYEFTQRCVSWFFGVALGLWTSLPGAYAINPPDDSLLDAPRKCPPGQLQNKQGLPITKEDVERQKEERQWNYPIEIPWDGILVDDPGHPLDIEARVHQVLQVIWQDRWEAIEHEACEILGVKSLHDYLRKPAGFFADHLKRYSKSRRQAPIYWPLSTASGSYTLWVYYHRLTENTLHTALADFIDPKLRSVRAEIASLRESGVRRDRLEELLDLEKELEDFRAEIERIIKLPWKPNLNDGVLITASPLWKLFRLPRWQKDLKACWEQLAKGEYDWTRLAYTIWPTRVEDVCKTDRSIAIAHGLEHLCTIEAPKPKAKRGKKTSTPTLEVMEP